MKSTKHTPTKKPALKTHFTPEKFAELPCLGIFDRYFSIEQQVQITRLGRAGDFEGTTMRERDEKTIAVLAQAALFVFGLDRIAQDAFDEVSSIVFDGNGDDSGIINAVINEQAGEKWTLKQRRHEYETALKGRAA